MTTSYLLDNDEEIAEYSGNTVLRRFISGGAVDDRIAHAEGSTVSNPSKTFYHTNHQGSVVVLTDSAGNVGQRISYDEYGNISSGSSATGEQYRFTGRRYDPETGLYYYRARYYVPQVGRFLQADSIGYKDDLNLYAYVYNDPLGRTDPGGENAIAVGGAVVAGGILLCAAMPSCYQGLVNALDSIYSESSEAPPVPAPSTPSDVSTPAPPDPDDDENERATGSVSVTEWKGYPEGVAKPQGPVRPISGRAYAQARQAANKANRAIRRADPAAVKGKQIHEVKPVKMGGEPVDPANKVPVDPQTHSELSKFWQSFLKWWQNGQ